MPPKGKAFRNSSLKTKNKQRITLFLAKKRKAKKKKQKKKELDTLYILKWAVERRHKIPQALDLRAC